MLNYNSTANNLSDRITVRFIDFGFSTSNYTKNNVANFITEFSYLPDPMLAYTRYRKHGINSGKRINKFELNLIFQKNQNIKHSSPRTPLQYTIQPLSKPPPIQTKKHERNHKNVQSTLRTKLFKIN
jgi:hypothetical protein